MIPTQESFTSEERHELAERAITRLIGDSQNGRVRMNAELAEVVVGCIRGTDPEVFRNLHVLVERLDEAGEEEGAPAIVRGSPETAPPGELTPGSIAIYAVNHLIAVAEREHLEQNQPLIEVLKNCVRSAGVASLRNLKSLLRQQELERPDLQH